MMSEQQAIIQAKRLKSYYPYRIVGIYYNGKEWDTFCNITKAHCNNLVKKGFEVYILNGE